MLLPIRIISAFLVLGFSGCAPLPAVSQPKGDTKQPLPNPSPDDKEREAFQLALGQANQALQNKEYKKAVDYLATLQPSEKTAQVYQTILLAKAYIGLGDYVSGDAVLANALSWVAGSTWRNYLINIRLETFPRTPASDSAQFAYYQEIRLSRLNPEVRYNAILQIFRLRGFNGSPEGFEEELEQLISLSHADIRLDSLYQRVVSRVEIGHPSWRWQTLLLAWEEKKSLFTNAIPRAESMRKLAPGPVEAKSHALRIAGLHYKNRDYVKAAAGYLDFINTHGTDPEALLQIARSYDRLKQSDKSLIWYDRFIEEYPNHDKTSEIYWLRGWELEAEEKYDEAIGYYQRQLTRFSRGRRGEWANFRIGYSYYKAGNLPEALKAFRNVRGQASSTVADAGLYWEGRTLDDLGKSDSARLVFAETYQKFHFRFYGQLAKEILKERKWWADSLDLVVDFGKQHNGDVQSWMKGSLSRFKADIDRSYESEYVSIPRLLQLKLDTLAIFTLETYPAAISSNPWFLFAYAKLLQEHGIWGESYRLALRLNQQIPTEDMGKVPREVLKLIYPKPYPELVGLNALEQKLDPEFIYALMKQESAFDHRIKSWAGAVGLMQIMPATGRALAQRVRFDDFNTYLLESPDVNIRLGTTYLRELKGKYENNYFFVLANYNAGPTPAARWQKLHGKKPLHLMVEEISYWETRDYLKKVMGNYWTYRQIWSEKP